MKLYLYVTNPEEFLNRDFDFSLTISSRESMPIDSWIPLGSIDDVEFDIDEMEVRKIAVSAIDEKIKEVRAVTEKGVIELEARKQKLLALTHDKK